MRAKEIKCRCGKSSQGFFKDIGPYYIDECCTEAGYDHTGNLKKSDPRGRDLPINPLDLESLATTDLPQDDTSPEPEEPTEESNPTLEQVEVHKKELEANPPNLRKKRQYNRNGKLKLKNESV